MLAAESKLSRRDCLLELISPVVISKPIKRFHLQAVAEQVDAEVSMWALRAHFGSFEGMLRAVWNRQVTPLVEYLDARVPPGRGVQDSIRTYIELVAEVMQSDSYHSVMIMLARYGLDYPWLQQSYDELISNLIRQKFELAVEQGSRSSGYAIAIKDGTADHLHKKMQTELAACRIIPPYQPRQFPDVHAIIARTAADAFKGTYALDLMAGKRP